MTDQELNEVVARKLGWIKPTRKLEPWKLKNNPGVMRSRAEMPDYCHSIAAAWKIFDFLIAEGGGGAVLYSEQRKRWEAALTDGRNQADSIETADTAPEAICLAFLNLP